MNSDKVYYYLFWYICHLTDVCKQLCAVHQTSPRQNARSSPGAKSIPPVPLPVEIILLFYSIISNRMGPRPRGHGHAGLRPRPTATPTPAHDCTINVTIKYRNY